MKKAKSVVLGSILIMSCLLLACGCNITSGNTGDEIQGSATLIVAQSTAGAPTIDGNWNSAEWADADSFENTEMIIYAMEDGTYAYFCVVSKLDTTESMSDSA